MNSVLNINSLVRKSELQKNRNSRRDELQLKIDCISIGEILHCV